MQFLGRETFFTALERKGQLAEPIAPGAYRFTVSAGGGFLAEDAVEELRVAPGKVSRARIAVTPLFDPRARGWYAADLHHHADQAEAVTPPRELARSQLAAGLDVLFVSDHDSTANTAALQSDCTRPRCAVHPRDRAVAFLGPLQRLPPRSTGEARHRYQHRHRGGGSAGGAP